jgi:hypothetical protein
MTILGVIYTYSFFNIAGGFVLVGSKTLTCETAKLKVVHKNITKPARLFKICVSAQSFSDHSHILSPFPKATTKYQARRRLCVYFFGRILPSFTEAGQNEQIRNALTE